MSSYGESVSLSMLLDRIIALETKMSVLEAKELKHQKPSPPTFHTPNISFIDWVKSLEPTREHLEHVLSQGYIQGMSIILCALIEQSLDPPIQINHSKKNQLYVYQLNKWSISENKQFEMFVDVIQFKLFKLFKQWKQENPKYALDEYSEILSKYNENILGTKFSKVTTVERIKLAVYRSLL